MSRLLRIAILLEVGTKKLFSFNFVDFKHFQTKMKYNIPIIYVKKCLNELERKNKTKVLIETNKI